MNEKAWFWCVTCEIATTGPHNDRCSLVGPYATALEAFEWGKPSEQEQTP